MKSVFSKALPAIFAGAVLVSGAVWAAEPSDSDVDAAIRDLQTKVTELQEQKKQTDAAKFAEALGDAKTRSQLMQVSGPDYSVGYDKGFFLQSADKAFSLKPGFLLQARNNTVWREEAKNGGTSDDIQNGWEIRRLKLYATGNVYSPDFTYGVQLTNNRNAAGIELDDVYVQYKFAKHHAIKVGQYKGPFNREELIGDGGQLAVERSLLNEVLGGGVTGPRLQGISLLGGFGGEDFNKDPVRYEVQFNDGNGSANTDFRDTASTPDTRPNWGAIARIDYKVSGAWSDLNKISAKNTKEDLLVFGAATAISGNEGNDNYRFTVDGIYQGVGGKLSLYGAVIASLTETRNVAPTAEDSRLDWGAHLQAGYLITPQWEPFVRGAIVVLDEDFITGAVGDEFYPELTIGVSRYLGKNGEYFNRAKFTVDVTYLPSGAPTSDRTGLGELTSGGRNEVVVRAQFQFQL